MRRVAISAAEPSKPPLELSGLSLITLSDNVSPSAHPYPLAHGRFLVVSSAGAVMSLSYPRSAASGGWVLR